MFSRDDKVSAIRLTAAQYMILAIFLVLAYGLWKLQVMESGYYASAAEKNRIRNVPILAPRGKILDREGRSQGEMADLVRESHGAMKFLGKRMYENYPVSYTHLTLPTKRIV